MRMKALSVIAFAACASLPAVAQTPSPPYPYPYPYHPYPYPPYATVVPGIYFEVTGGAMFPNHVTLTSRGSISGVPATSSGSVNFKNGYVATGLVGFQANPYVAVELEGGYTQFDIKSGTATVTFTNGATSSGPISGSQNAILGFGNIIVSPLGIYRRFGPYIGGGGGVAAFQGGGNLGGLSFSSNGRQALPAVDGVFGFNLALADGVKIGTRYRYMWVDVHASHAVNVSTNVTGHSVSLTASVQF